MADSDLIGQLLHDTYRIKREMAQGGMGTVYEAAHVKLTSKRYAIKVLHQHISDVADVYQRFLREANIAADLGHPNIVNVTDFQETPEGQPYMVMEYLDGEDLGAYLASRGKLEPDELLRIVRQVGSALQAAHDQGIVHRDIKPENIFLARTADGATAVKVLDFGISKIRHSKSIVTKNLSILGTPQYMSPEQGEGDVEAIDHTTDIFALGIICYKALSGELPFDGPSLMAVVRAVCDKPHRPPSEVSPSLGNEVDRVLGKALSKTKQERYQRVGEFVEELARALEELTLAPATLPGPSSPVTPAPGGTMTPAPAYHDHQTQAPANTYASAAGEAIPPPRNTGLLVPLLVLMAVLLVGGAALTGVLWWSMIPSVEERAVQASTRSGAAKVTVRAESTRKAASIKPPSRTPATGTPGGTDDAALPEGVPTVEEIHKAVKVEIEGAVKAAPRAP